MSDETPELPKDIAAPAEPITASPTPATSAVVKGAAPPSALNWQNTLDGFRKFVVRLRTPGGTGTGFLLTSSKDDGVVGIATAAHVISYSHEWGLPIKVTHYLSDNTVLLKEKDRSIHIDERRDLSVVRFKRELLPVLADETPGVIPADRFVREAVEIGWCGFPAVHPSKLCFFSGRVSAYLDDEDAYLVDGVAINGVSGSAAFYITGQVAGLVTAYIVNRATGEALPGVSLIRSVKPLLELFEASENRPTTSASDSPVAPQPTKAPVTPTRECR